jgi:hypothetical protein
VSGNQVFHITNGDATAELMRSAGVAGPIIVWRDMLHEGPVPAGVPLPELSRLRAEYVASVTGSPLADVRGQFDERDGLLADAVAAGQIVLWFEHDLYDQLQLLQLLDWLGSHGGPDLPVTLICIGAYPGVARFTGLAQLTPAQLRTLAGHRHRVTGPEFALARAAWAAFRAPEPRTLYTLAQGDTAALPFLRAALTRHLEDLPHTLSGLSRTEQQLVEVIRDGMKGPYEIFIAAQEREKAPFLGDATAWSLLRSLSSGPAPLLSCASGDFAPPSGGLSDAAFLRQSMAVTDLGKEVVAGRRDWMAPHGIDRWLGGVHLLGTTPAWRWDERRGRLVAGPS